MKAISIAFALVLLSMLPAHGEDATPQRISISPELRQHIKDEFRKVQIQRLKRVIAVMRTEHEPGQYADEAQAARWAIVKYAVDHTIVTWDDLGITKTELDVLCDGGELG